MTEQVEQPRLGVGGTVRWLWRQLTSMRVALILLFLLAVAAIPGSVFPQRGVDPIRVERFLVNNPTSGPWLDRFGAFDVYATPWFAAIYLLLMISLAGCIIPRVGHHARALRAAPPATPRNLSRLPVWQGATTSEQPSDVIGRADEWFRQRRFRHRIEEDHTAISAEKGYIRETGNLVFHVSLLILLVGISIGGLFGYRGTVIVVQGQGFANTLTSYDDFHSGRRFDPSSLPPFSFNLTDFNATFVESGPRLGQPADFNATVSYVTRPGASPQTYDIRVNHPLRVDGSKVYLLGHGYAPVFTVRDGDGNVVSRDPVVVLPQDPAFTSVGVIKAPDASPEALGFNIRFTPTAPPVVDPKTGPVSIFPAAGDPRAFLGAWKGDLGLDTGAPQSVYVLDTSKMTQVGNRELKIGQIWRLPDGAGSIRFDGLKEWGNFQVASDPGRQLVLLGAVLAISGVIVSLRVPRRRLWVRVVSDPAGRTLVEVAGLARSESAKLDEEVHDLFSALVPNTDRVGVET